jgi:hypothetical protein
MTTPTTSTTPPADQNVAQRAIAVGVRWLGYLVYAYLLLTLVVLGVGFFLLLFGANPSAGFVELVYRSLSRAMEPFRGMFTPIDLGTTNQDVPAILDVSILFAMVVYGIVAMLLHAALMWLGDRIDHIDQANELRRETAEYEARTAQRQMQLAELQAEAARAQAARAQAEAEAAALRAKAEADAARSVADLARSTKPTVPPPPR